MRIVKKEDIKVQIEKCSDNCIHQLAKQLRLDNKLTDEYIRLLIERCDCDYIHRLAEQLPEDYKPSEEVIKILDKKGYKVL